MTEGSSAELAKLTKIFIKIRSKRSELTAGYKERDEELRSQQDKIKQALLDHCKEHDVESVRTSEGLFYRTTKTRYWTSDWEHMYDFIKEHDVPEFLEKRLNQSNVKQFLEENPECVPQGLNVDSEYLISVRRK
jgi:phage pi2 protein 07